MIQTIAEIDVNDIDLYDKSKNVKLERTVLKFLITRDYSLVSKLRREYFTLMVHQKIFDLCKTTKTLLTAAMIRDTLKKVSKDKNEYEEMTPIVDRLFQTKVKSYSAKMIEVLIQSLHEHFLLRQSVITAINIVNAAKERKLETITTEVKNYLRFENKNTHIESREYLDSFEERKEHLIYLQNNISVMGCLTGVKKLDETLGALKAGEYGIIIGDTGVGKSIMLENILLYNYLFCKKNVLFVSLEMPTIQVMNRADSYIHRMLYKHFRTGNLSPSELRAWEHKIAKMRSTFQNKFSVAHMKRSTSADEIQEEAYRLQEELGIKFDLIGIDYLNLMRANNSKSRSLNWEEMGEVSWDVKCLSQDFNGVGVPIWIPNQKKDGTVKYGKAILENAPFCIDLTRTEDEEIEQIIKLTLLKTRDTGEWGKEIVLKPNMDYMQISQIEEERAFQAAENSKRKRTKTLGD